MANKISGKVDFSYSDHPLPYGLSWITPVDPNTAELSYKGQPVDGEWIQNDSLPSVLASKYVDFTDQLGVVHYLESRMRIVATNGIWSLTTAVSASPLPQVTSNTSRNGQVEIIVSSGCGLVTNANDSTNSVWVLEEKGNSQDTATIEVTSNTPSGGSGVIISQFVGTSFSLGVGESAAFYAGQWARVSKGGTVALPMRHMTCGNVEVEYSSGCNFMTQPQAFVTDVQLHDLGSVAGSTIKNVSPPGVGGAAIYIRHGVPPYQWNCISPGEETVFDVARGWLKTAPVFSTSLFGNLTISSCDKCQLSCSFAMADKDLLEVVESGSKAGAVIKNESTGSPTTQIFIWADSGRSVLKCIVSSGQEATFDGSVWVARASVKANTAVSGSALKVNSWVPMIYNQTSQRWNIDLVERHPISNARAKKCTCGNLNHGACSTWCDLVRTDD